MGGIGTALAVAAIGTTYSAIEQKKAQKKSMDAQMQAELNARRIAAEQKPMEESAKLELAPQSGAGGGIMDLMINPDFKKKPSIGSGTASSSVGLGIGA